MSNPAHVRIDEGVKRGPRKPRNKQSAESGRFLPVLPAEQHLAIVATASERIANGERLADIAQDAGITVQAVSLWLLDEQPEQYRLAQRRGLIRRIVDADHALDSAADPLDLARARERARFARWDAERRLPALFGQKQQVDVSVKVSVEHRLESSASQLLEAFVALPQQSAVQHDSDAESLSTEDDQAIDV